MKKKIIAAVAFILVAATVMAQETMKIEMKDGTTVSYSVADISRFYFDDEAIPSHDGIAPNCEVFFVDELVLPTQFALLVGFGSELEYVKVIAYHPEALDGLTDDVIIADVAANGASVDKSEMMITGANMPEGRHLVIACVGFNAEGKHGALYLHDITMKVAADEPLAEVTSCKYNDESFMFTIEIDDDKVLEYYLYYEVGDDVHVWSNTAEFGLLWKYAIEEDEDKGLYYLGDDFVVERPNGASQLFVSTWCLDYDQNFSGNIFWGLYNISRARAKNLSPMMNVNEDEALLIRGVNFKEELRKLKNMKMVRVRK